MAIACPAFAAAAVHSIAPQPAGVWCAAGMHDHSMCQYFRCASFEAGAVPGRSCRNRSPTCLRPIEHNERIERAEARSA